jgi:hypothetical protein
VFLANVSGEVIEKPYGVLLKWGNWGQISTFNISPSGLYPYCGLNLDQGLCSSLYIRKFRAVWYSGDERAIHRSNYLKHQSVSFCLEYDN